MLKTAPKILISTFLTIFIAQMFGLIFLLAAPNATRAADAPYLQVKIGAKLKNITPDKESGKLSIPWIGEYIQAIYRYAIGVVGILAAVVLMVGGIVWLTAGGNQTRIGEAKAWIGASLTGLVIALSSYMLLWIVNPALVQFRPIGVTTIDKIITGRCITTGTPDICKNNFTENDCLKNNPDNKWEEDKTCPTNCCAWDSNLIATAACKIPGTDCSGTLYNNCKTKPKLTKEQCAYNANYANYTQDPSYKKNSECAVFTFAKTSYLTSYKCVSQ